MGGRKSTGAAARLLRPDQSQTWPPGRSRRSGKKACGSGLAHVDQAGRLSVGSPEPRGAQDSGDGIAGCGFH